MKEVDKNEAPEGFMALPWSKCRDCHFHGSPNCDDMGCMPRDRKDGCNVIFVKDKSCKRVNPLVYEILSSLKQTRYELTLLGGKILETYRLIDLIDKAIAKVEALK